MTAKQQLLVMSPLHASSQADYEIGPLALDLLSVPFGFSGRLAPKHPLAERDTGACAAMSIR